jgi:hypothetical protein
LQMFNFKGSISKVQIERFKALQGFLGGCVHNIGDFARCITTMFGVRAQLGGAQESIERVASDPDSGMQLYRKLYGPIDAARVISEKILEASIINLENNLIPVPSHLMRKNTTTTQE